jgi:DNA-binding response OmpR family regulator
VGADDYVTKPFDTDVLRARMRNAIRRNKATPAGAVQISFIPVGDCQIDPWTRNISHPGGATERLTEMEIQLLTALLQTPDCVTDRDNLSRLISGQEWSPNNRSLDVHISHLRKKLERLTNMKNTIVSFRGIGYALQLEAFKQVTE